MVKPSWELTQPYYEAATVDGASKWQRIRNITIPQLTSLITVLTILAVGNIFRADFGLFYQIPITLESLYSVTNVLMFMSTTVWPNRGYRMTAAAGLYQSVCRFGSCYPQHHCRRIDKNAALLFLERRIVWKNQKFKKKIDNVGIHSFSKKSKFFFSLVVTLVFDLVSSLHLRYMISIWQTNKIILGYMVFHSQKFGFDGSQSSWLQFKDKILQASSSLFLWPLSEQQ